MLSVLRYVGVGAAAVALWGAALGCGSGGGKSESFASIEEGISSPSGTVSETTIGKIGEKFESASANTFLGVRDDDQVGQSSSASATIDCPAGGKYTASGSGNQSNARGTARFDNCCFTEGCCASGSATVFASTEQNSTYRTCASYDMDYNCRGVTAAVEYSGCFAVSGARILLIDVDGQSFAVSGTRSGGSGTLQITGANGSWMCSFSSGSGSCSSSGGTSFSFSKG